MFKPIPSFPFIPDDLLDELEKRFPERSPDPVWDERKIWMEVGKREVVRFLRAKQKEQKNQESESKVNVSV